MSGVMKTKVTVLTLLAGLALAGCGEEPAPLFPSYQHDVKPLMKARCIRCHGANGTLNLDPDSAKVSGTQAPIDGDFTQLEDNGTIHGLLFYTKNGPTPLGLTKMGLYLPQMPPSPAPELTDREFQIINTWANNPLP
jgi:hypothetical protein